MSKKYFGIKVRGGNSRQINFVGLPIQTSGSQVQSSMGSPDFLMIQEDEDGIFPQICK